jgi:NADP-dependent 3-hydroxy acid dehydrogenase YdfG
MDHSNALVVTGTTSGLGYAAASMLAAKGYRQVIVTVRSLARIQEAATQLAAESLNAPASVQAALAEAGQSEVGGSISYCSMPGWSQVRSACSLQRASRRLRPR